MKKLFFAIPVLALAIAGCVKDEPFVNPEPDPTPTPPTPSVDAKIVFNEFDCQNKKIELYNTGDSEVDMTGWILSKDGTEWEIPASRGKIAAKGFAVFTGKSDGTTDPTFGLSGTKGFLMVLKDKGGKEIDTVVNTSDRDGGIVAIEDGKSWGRKTDGASEWVIFDTPSIGASNGSGVAPEPEGRVCINEVNCGTKEFEIYNGTSKAVDIAGYTFTKDGKDAWTVPAGKGNIPAKGYLVFVAKNSDPNEGPAFGLSGTKGFILCMYKSDDISDANLVDKIDNSATAETFKTVEDGKSLGRKTDGADEWVIFDTPTLGSANK